MRQAAGVSAASAPRAGPTERLNRFLARRGVSSRRGADVLIASGRVEVNGFPADLGASVDAATDRVTVDGVALPSAQERRTVMLNKPMGAVSTRHDPQGRPTVMDLVDAVPGLVPVGRLDIDSRGLLLLTTDGSLAHRLTHPRFGITKHYRVAVTGPVTPDRLRRLRAGVILEDGPARALNARAAGPRLLELVIGEGRKREVRRLCAAVGLEVADLQRVAVGPLQLGDLDQGASRALSPGEAVALYAAVGLPPPVGAR